MAEATPTHALRSPEGVGQQRREELKMFAPQLEPRLPLLAVHFSSVDGAVSDFVTATARDRAAAIAQEMKLFHDDLKAHETLGGAITALWRGRTAMRHAVGEGLLGGARNLEAALTARKTILAQNNPYAMENERLWKTEASNDWEGARASIVQRLVLASQSRFGHLPGEKFRTFPMELGPSAHDDSLPARLRSVTANILCNTIVDEMAQSKDDEVFAQAVSEGLRTNLTKTDYVALFGPQASGVVIGDSLLRAKQKIVERLKECGITDREEIAALIEASLEKSAVVTGTAKVGAVGSTPVSIERVLSRLNFHNERLGKFLAPASRALGGSAVRMVATGAFVALAGAQGIVLSAVSGAAAAPVMTAARSFNNARRNVAFDRRTVATIESASEDASKFYMREGIVRSAPLLLKELDIALTNPDVNAGCLFNEIQALYYNNHRIDLIAYTPGQTDQERAQLMQKMHELRDKLEEAKFSDDVEIELEKNSRQHEARIHHHVEMLRGESNEYVYNRETLNARRLGKAAIYGAIGGGIAGGSGDLLRWMWPNDAPMTTAGTTVYAMQLPEAHPTPAVTGLTPHYQAIALETSGPIPHPVNIYDGKLLLTDQSIISSEDLKITPGSVNGFKVLSKKGETLADNIQVAVDAHGTPTAEMKRVLLENNLKVVKRPSVNTVSDSDPQAPVVRSTPREFMAQYDTIFDTVDVQERAWPTTPGEPVVATKTDAGGRVHIVTRGISPDMPVFPRQAVVTLNETEKSIVLSLGSDGRLALAPHHPLAQIIAQQQFASLEVGEMSQNGRLKVMATMLGDNFGAAHGKVSRATEYIAPQPHETVYSLQQVEIPPRAREVTASPTPQVITPTVYPTQDRIQSDGAMAVFDDPLGAQDFDKRVLLGMSAIVAGSIVGTTFNRVLKKRHYNARIVAWARNISLYFRDVVATSPQASIPEVLNSRRRAMIKILGEQEGTSLYWAVLHKLNVADLAGKDGEIPAENADIFAAHVCAYTTVTAA